MKHLVASLCAVLIVLAGLIVLSTPAEAQAPVGTFVDTMTVFRQPSVTNALADLEQNRMDMYLWFASTPSDIAAARSNPALRTNVVGGSLRNLQVNPIPVAPNLGKINPFEKRELREALNYIVNREFLVREIAPGNDPMYTSYFRATPDYGREALFFSGIERQYAFNPTLGRQMIVNALSADPTYMLVGGKWMWNDRGTDKPVEITFVIRVEDDRQSQGNYIAGVLEGLGFTVVRNYQTGAGANTIVYQGPPDTGAWHLYTEGFGGGAIQAFDDSNLWNFYVGDAYGSAIFYLGNHTGSCQNCPLPAKADPALIDSATKLFEADYTGMAERQALLKQAVALSIKDSTRVFLYNNAVFPYSSRVSGFVYDLNAGPWSIFTPRTARFATPGGDLRVGQRVWAIEGWQPWRVDWLFDALHIQMFTDLPIYPNPHTGLWIPVRSTWAVTPATTVPTTALTWDSTTLGYKPATATPVKNRVDFTFTFGTWHDGSTFDMDDVLYETALVFRRANGPLGRGDINAVDADAAAGASLLFARIVKGIEVSGNTLSLYIDYNHPDPSTTAGTVALPMFPVSPWTASELALATAMTPTPTTAPCRVSGTTAAAEGKQHVDMAKGPCKDAMSERLAGLASANHRPPGLDAFITAAEATARWSALTNWNTTHGHFFVSNGPFMLDRVDATAEQAFYKRDPAYPFPADRWDALLTPKIPTVAFGPSPTVLQGRPATFDLTSTVLGGAPYDLFNMTWLLLNPAAPAGTPPIAQGSPTKVADGSYRITLPATTTATLVPGAYELRTITVGNEAAVPVFATATFIAIPDVDTIVAQLRATIQVLERDLDRAQSSQANETARLNAALNSAQTTAIIGMGVGVVGVIAGVAGIALAMRGRKPRGPPGSQPEEL